MLEVNATKWRHDPVIVNHWYFAHAHLEAFLGDGCGDGGDNDFDAKSSQWNMTRRCTMPWLGEFSNPCHTLNDANEDEDDYSAIGMTVVIMRLALMIEMNIMILYFIKWRWMMVAFDSWTLSIG